MKLERHSDAPPDVIDLERALLDGDEAAVDEARAANPQAFEALEQARQLFVEKRSPLRPARRFAVLGGGLLLLAAVGLAVALPALAPDDDGMRAMGQQSTLEISVQQDDQRIWLAVTPERAGYLSVATVQDDGNVSVLLAGDQMPVAAGVQDDVDGTVRLDGYAGREWLVVRYTPEPVDGPHVVTHAKALLPDPSAGAGEGVWVMEVTRR